MTTGNNESKENIKQQIQHDKLSSGKCCLNWNKCSLKLFLINFQSHPSFDIKPISITLIHYQQLKNKFPTDSLVLKKCFIINLFSYFSFDLKGMLTFDLKWMSRIAQYMKTDLVQRLILDWSMHLYKNLSLTLVLHVYYCKVLATLNLQTLDLKTSRYQCTGMG